MFISLSELFDMVIMTLAVGFIFSDLFAQRVDIKKYDPLKVSQKSLQWEHVKIAAIITAPGIILHEMAHKFTALGYGFIAEFHASYFWLGLGLLLKALNSSFIFFVPGYVSISGQGSNLEFALVALAGPLFNLILWIVGILILRTKSLPKKYVSYVYAFKQINLFLFIFNMLPIPGFDGFSFYYKMYLAFF